MPPTAPARVLVVEDEPVIREALVRALADAGYAVAAAEDGPAALAAAAAGFRPDLALLDVMLPGVDGLAVARALRRTHEVALVFLTARDAVDDRLAGFGVGADDYVVKPFVLEELLARVAAVLRRTGRLSPSAVEVGGLVLDEAAQTASRGGQRLDLTGTEWRLLAYLVRHRGRTLSKTQILTQVWGYDDYDPNLVEVHVSALRRKLEAHGPRLVHTARGLGYVVRE